MDFGYCQLHEAAPELLEACETALEFIRPISSFIGKESVTEKKIKTAIQKAKA